MRKGFNKVQAAARKIIAAKTPAQKSAALAAFEKAHLEYSETGEDRPTLLFCDDIHASASISHWGDVGRAATREHTANELYRIKSDNEFVILTGLQLSNLAGWWMRHTSQIDYDKPGKA